MLALKYISPTMFSIFQPSVPCIATVISIFLKMETLTSIKVLGILMSVGGAIIAEVWKQDGSSGSGAANDDMVLGTVIVTCQVVGMACLVVFSKPMLDKYPPPAVTLVYYAIGTGYTIILSVIFAYSLTLEGNLQLICCSESSLTVLYLVHCRSRLQWHAAPLAGTGLR